MAKVLFVYPNKEGYPIIPIGISILSGVLKNSGHETDLFDATFMMPQRLDHDAREKTGVVKKVDVVKHWGRAERFDIGEEFKKKITSFNPDLIAFSIVENNYGFAKSLFAIAREASSVPIIAGGIFPTVAPEFIIEDDNVDIVCIGEGERSLLELLDRLNNKKDLSNIPNLIVKNDSGKIESSFSAFYKWDPPVYQDWDIFDQRHLLKPFMGRMWRSGFFEASRGCPFSCSYCMNKIYQKKFKSLGAYRREKPIECVMNEIEYMKKEYSLEIIFFNDENFMMMKDDRFKEFCRGFMDRISLPFFIQTSAETLLDEKYVRALKEAGCITIGIGIETGSEKIRKELLNKSTPNYVYQRSFDNCNKYKIRTTAYVMIGLPFETEEDILATADFCRKLNAESIAISIFAPYHGTALYETCVNNGFIEDRYHEDISVNYSSILKMPQLSKEKLEELYYKFNDLVYRNKEAVRNEN